MLNNEVHFIFDSKHIEDIDSRLYGFCVTESSLMTNLPLDNEDISDSTGSWVLVKRYKDHIEVTQDSIGCFGLFLFRDENYWALSNSFNHLLDYLKSNYKLTFNKEYADAYLAQGNNSAVYGETIIKEINWLDRRAKVLIDILSGLLSVSYRSLAEKTVPVDTEEGIKILDAWHDKWARFASRSVKKWPGEVEIELSGGFDTRMVFAPILSSGISHDEAMFYSEINLKEDLAIASKLVDEFKLAINQEIGSNRCHALCTLEDTSGRVFPAILFEKLIYAVNAESRRVPKIIFSGYGGETLRGFWENKDCGKYVKYNLRPLPNNIKPDDFSGIHIGEPIVRRSFESIELMLRQTEGLDLHNSLNGGQYFAETDNRVHFGMAIARNCMSQRYRLTPLLDPLLLKLYVPPQYKQPLLLVTLILSRYHSKLIDVPFEGNRTIPDETLQLAREINERFPRKKINLKKDSIKSSTSLWQPIHCEGNLSDSAYMANEDVSIVEQMKIAYASPTVQELFSKCYGSPARDWIDPRLERKHPGTSMRSIVAVAKVLEDVQLGKDAHADIGAFVKDCYMEAITLNAYDEIENLFDFQNNNKGLRNLFKRLVGKLIKSERNK